MFYSGIVFFNMIIGIIATSESSLVNKLEEFISSRN